MREIPNKILILVGEDIPLDKKLNNIFITIPCPKRATSNQTLKRRKEKLKREYECGEVTALELDNTGFRLELLPYSEISTPWADSLPVILHHPQLPEYINYKICISVYKSWLLKTILESGTISNFLLSGSFCLKNDTGYIDNIILENNDPEIEKDKQLGILLGEKDNWTKTYIPGHRYYVETGVNNISDCIYLGKFDPILSSSKYLSSSISVSSNRYSGVNIFRALFPMEYPTEKRELTEDSLFNSGCFYTWQFLVSVNKKLPVIDLGEVNPEITSLLNNKDDFYSSCLNSDRNDCVWLSLVSPSYIKSHLPEFTKCLKRLSDLSGIATEDSLSRFFNLEKSEINSIFLNLYYDKR